MRKHTKIINYVDGYEVTNIDLVPREFMRPSVSRILETIRERGFEANIPGVKAIMRRVMSVRGS